MENHQQYEKLKRSTRELLDKIDKVASNATKQENKQNRPKRVRSRKKRFVDEAASEQSIRTETSFSGMSDDESLLLVLLSMCQDDWKEYLVQAAMDRGLLRLQHEIWGWSPLCRENIFTKAILDELNKNRLVRGVDRKRKKRKFQKLDESINELITDQSLHISLSPYKVKTEVDLNRVLEKFAMTLVNLNMGSIKEGELFISKRNAFVRTEPEVLIRNKKLRRCAFNGDIVRVFAFHTSQNTEKDGQLSPLGSPEDDDDDSREEPAIIVVPDEPEVKGKDLGFVIRVLHSDSAGRCTGSFAAGSTPKAANLVFMPHDFRLPPVHISSTSLQKVIPKHENIQDYFKDLPQKIFEARISTINSFLYIARGTIEAELGMKNHLMTENDCLLIKHGFNKQLDNRSSTLAEVFENISIDDDPRREDLTSMCIFTIDPATARDLDDAVSCTKLANGNYEVGVHISDVTHFVRENSQVDTMVKRSKTTSVYMVDQVYHMLPDELCQMCSLLPGVEKKAVSIFLEMTPSAKVVNRRFCRSLINSCCQLAYEQAQTFIENKPTNDKVVVYNNFSEDDLRTTILSLHGLAQILRKHRFDNGALKIDKPKFYFVLDQNKDPIEMLAEKSQDSNHLIEEFMIVANQLVGEFIYENYPTKAILRQHNPPDAQQMAKLRHLLKLHEFPEFNYKTAKDIAKSMDAVLADCDARGLDRSGFELIFNSMIARPMSRAQYFCTGEDKFSGKFDHFALSIPIYTHFTSPIRRYPDILVHRLVVRAMNKEMAPESWDLEELSRLMSVCNKHKMNARYCSEDSSQLFFRHYLQLKYPDGMKMRAAVCNIMTESMEVKLLATGDEILCRFAELRENGELVVGDESVKLIYYNGEHQPVEMVLKMFSVVDVTVRCINNTLRAAILIN